MGWSLLLVLALSTVVYGQRETCLSGDEEPYLHFGTKTAYVFGFKPISNLKPYEIPGCQPLAISLINRHGSHNPEQDELPELQKLMDLKNNILNNYRSGSFRQFNEKLCTSDLNLLERWTWNPRQNLTFAGDLTSDGYITTQHMAQAWRQKLPGLLTNNRHDYLFKYVNDKLSRTSFRAFTEGIFRDQAEDLDILKENDEKLLMPYKYCSAWKKGIDGENETLSQHNIFISKREYKEMITQISQRLGFSYDIHKDIVLRMYQMCRYNKAWDVTQISPWCAAFTKDDLKRLEYAEDLENYYKYGYGIWSNQRVGCTLVKDMMSFFTNHVEREAPQQPRSMIYFVDAPMILMTLTVLGAHKDAGPLTGDNYHSNLVQSRRWSGSTMSPFNANIAAVLYKCTPSGNFQVNDKYQVLFLENERPMYLEGCRVGLCDWSFVKDRFGEVASKCTEEACNSAVKVNGVFGLSIALILLSRLL